MIKDIDKTIESIIFANNVKCDNEQFLIEDIKKLQEEKYNECVAIFSHKLQKHILDQILIKEIIKIAKKENNTDWSKWIRKVLIGEDDLRLVTTVGRILRAKNQFRQSQREALKIKEGK